MSELSYSYSEMIGNDMEGSNYMSSKMRLSAGAGGVAGATGSYLKSYN